MATFIADSNSAARAKPRVDSLCLPSEVVYFGCRTARGKSISICGQQDGLIQYRYGKAQAIELRFPTKDQDAGKSLRYAHYSRPQVERFLATFEKAGTHYAINERWEGKRHAAGVDVTLPEGRTLTIACSGAVESRWNELEPLLPCDPDTALSQCAE